MHWFLTTFLVYIYLESNQLYGKENLLNFIVNDSNMVSIKISPSNKFWISDQN